MNIRFFKVGGAVRDQILNPGSKPKDVDYAVEAPSFEAMREEIVRRGGQIFVETPDFFTIRAKMRREFPHLPAGLTADFVLARKDGEYTDGRRPDSVSVGTIQDDLARRDFTVNAMAIDCETGEMIDPFDGLADCSAKVIRCVGKATKRFDEDKLRAFRAVRFAVTKKFEIARSTSDAIKTLLGGDFDGVSTERIREELFKMFSVNMLKSYDLVFRKFPNLGRVVLKRGIWFEPTTKARP